MTLDPLLIEVLACPVDKGPLLWFADEAALYNPRLRKRYEVRDGVPVMLVEEATEVDGAEHERLMAKAAAEHVPETGSAGEHAGSGENGPSPRAGAEGPADGG
ncbi:MAG: Trm112 family protein [Acidimicrobiales bacterium]